LHELQSTLATLQQGTNNEFIAKKHGLEEERDYELTKLRLWEEYQVKRIETEYNEDVTRAKDNHDKMIKLIKEKLYDKLQNQIKQLKEDKLLLNLVNANSWTNAKEDSATVALNAAAASSIAMNDRRSLRKREISSRFTTGEADDLSDGGLGGSTTAGNFSSHANGYISASKRRRHYATRYSSNDEMSSGLTSAATGGASGAGATSASGTGHTRNGHNGISSGNDSNLSDKDYDALNSLIMENEDGGPSLILMNKANNSNKPNTRGSNKQFVGVQGLKPEELNEDLTLLKNAIVKKEK
jgi:Sds3-like.